MSHKPLISPVLRFEDIESAYARILAPVQYYCQLYSLIILYVAFIASDEAAILLIDWRNGLYGSYLQDPGGM